MELPDVHGARGATRIVVVGGGVTGLAAARQLHASGLTTTVVEASDVVGGQLRTISFGGGPFDVGAEALHLHGSRATPLLDELGLVPDLVPAGPARPWLSAGGRLHPLPAGLGPAGPTRILPLATTSAVSVRGRLRAATEPVRCRPVVEDDPTAGPFFRRRFGPEVTERLIGPLVGAIYTADLDELSLDAVLPGVAEAARQGRSLLARRRDPAGPTVPVTLRGGLATLAGRLADDLPDVRVGRRAERLEGGPGAYRLHLAGGDVLDADAVVLAVPPARAGGILGGACGATLARLPDRRIAVVALAYPRAVLEEAPRALAGSGLVAPSGDGRMLRAATFSSTKWPHLAGRSCVLVRISLSWPGDLPAGAPSDDGLVDRAHAELRELTGLRSTPTAAAISRWRVPLPVVGRRSAVAAAADLLREEAIVLAGGAYDGVGVERCLDHGARAADGIRRRLAWRGVASGARR